MSFRNYISLIIYYHLNNLTFYLITHILYIYMLQMLYVRASEQKRFVDIRRFIHKNYYYYINIKVTYLFS